MQQSELLTTWLNIIQMNNRLSTIVCFVHSYIDRKQPMRRFIFFIWLGGETVSDSNPAFKPTKSGHLKKPTGGPCTVLTLSQDHGGKCVYSRCTCPCFKTKKNANLGLIQDISQDFNRNRIEKSDRNRL
jgi:hypothetical protein